MVRATHHGRRAITNDARNALSPRPDARSEVPQLCRSVLGDVEGGHEVPTTRTHYGSLLRHLPTPKVSGRGTPFRSPGAMSWARRSRRVPGRVATVGSNSGTGIGVWRVDRFGLRGTLLAEEDREDHDGADRQDPTPVLQRFEPELGAEETGPRRNAIVGQSANSCSLLNTRLPVAACKSSDTANMVRNTKLSERRYRTDAATPHRPWRLGIVPVSAWVLVLRGRLVERSRLRRATLHELHREQHVHAHLQELGLPVLERRLTEVGGRQVLAEGELALRRRGVARRCTVFNPATVWPPNQMARNVATTTTDRPFSRSKRFIGHVLSAILATLAYKRRQPPRSFAALAGTVEHASTHTRFDSKTMIGHADDGATRTARGWFTRRPGS